MHVHRFSVGEFVAFTEKRFPGLVWAGEWEVIDLVEAADGRPHYRLRGPDGITSDAIPEADLGPRTVDQRGYPFA